MQGQNNPFISKAEGSGKTSKAYRYVSEGELDAIKKTGQIPNTDRLGSPKDIFVSPNKYNKVSTAEEGLQIGSKNPFGSTASPTHRIEFDMNSVPYRYGGNVQGGKGIELITGQSIPIDIRNIYKLK